MFEKLEVYQKAVDFAEEIAALTEGFPPGSGFLVDQLNRAALSIATNLAEGNGRFTKPDRRNFSTVARGSAQEGVAVPSLASRIAFTRGVAVAEQNGRTLTAVIRIETATLIRKRSRSEL
jgi:four helix bundle protein